MNERLRDASPLRPEEKIKCLDAVPTNWQEHRAQFLAFLQLDTDLELETAIDYLYERQLQKVLVKERLAGKQIDFVRANLIRSRDTLAQIFVRDFQGQMGVVMKHIFDNLRD